MLGKYCLGFGSSKHSFFDQNAGTPGIFFLTGLEISFNCTFHSSFNSFGPGLRLYITGSNVQSGTAGIIYSIVNTILYGHLIFFRIAGHPCQHEVHMILFAGILP
jgi:hypothetical protein